MRPLKLHTKTTLLASAITVAVLAVALAYTTTRVAEIVRDEQKARAELQALSFAEQIGSMPEPLDPQALAQAAALVRGARPDVVAVRVWKRVGGVYLPTAAAGDAGPADIPDDTKAALRSGLASHTASARPAGARASVYRVFVPIKEGDRLSGAVELVEQLEDAPTIARSFNRMIARLRTMTEEREAQRLVLQERVQEATAELQQRYEQLEEQKQELEEKNLELLRMHQMSSQLERLAAAGQTAAQFAHEVATPLSLISGHVQLLSAQLGADERAGKRLNTISAQIERIERIVLSMLDRTRPEAVALAPLDLNALLGRIFDTVAPALDARRVRLQTELTEPLPAVAGDADRLQQVFINLINNALDAMPDGGDLRVRTSREAAQVCVEFTDT